jgi:hypothetical protein
MQHRATKADVFKLLGYIQDDLRQTQAKLVEVRSMLAAGAMEHEPTDAVKCPLPHCGSDGFDTERMLAFHVQNVHGGPPVPLSAVEEAG